jgi:hypothetical protein
MKKIGLISIALIGTLPLFAQNLIANKTEPGAFPIVSGEQAATIYVDGNDHWLVQKAAALLQTDIEKVTGKKPDTVHALTSGIKNIILIGSADKSALIKQLVDAGKLRTDSIKGKWEAFQLQVVHHPYPGVDNALVIAGSDRRGTAYGVFELSKQIGVSPWYWWADVPVKKNKELWFTGKAPLQEAPGVTYRGIFINDEAPALSEWSKATFGGFNHLFYEKVFELLLRLKGNYLWPAMWGNAFYDDDTLNPVLADQYGIVIGTSHHEPMLRAHDEWRRYGSGKWDYDSNENRLKAFWEQGIRRMHSYESIVTVGMRGDGDKPMTAGSNIALLERIISDQRKIISTITGKDAAATPQLWALYKEVQDYYDKGMRVPEDVTLLLCDDNWGNVRKLPKWNAPARAGGYGMYYHFDYVGGPRNYKWINTNSIPRVWEQMHLTYEYGVNRIWIVNVGDIKPMELPISFFLDYAWNPKYTVEQTSRYTCDWAAQQFGVKNAAAIGDILSKYTQYNSRRKPELLSPDTYSLTNYREAETVEQDYNKLANEAQKIYESLPAEYKDAYDQLVLFPVKASANLNQLYITAGKNHLYAKQGRSVTNDLATQCKELFITDSLLSYHYNKIMAHGKWNHMMDQTHIGYTWWQQPPVNKMPAVKTIAIPNKANLGIAVEGSESVWPGDTAQAVLPEFNVLNQSKHYIDVFNRGSVPFTYTIVSGEPWLNLSPAQKGEIIKSQRISVDVNWSKVPAGVHRVPVTIASPDKTKVTVYAIIKKIVFPHQKNEDGFAETDGYISIDADQYNRAVNDNVMQWYTIPGIGRTGNGVTTRVNFSKASKLVQGAATAEKGNGARLEYSIYCTDTGMVKVMAYCSPTLPFNESSGLRYAISFDNEAPQIINLHADNSEKAWAQSVSDNIRISTSIHTLHKSNHHTLKLWAVDPGIVLQKLVIDFGGVKKSYLGPPAFQRFLN